MHNKFVTAVAVVLVLPALCFSGYKLYQHFVSPESTEDNVDSSTGEKSTTRSGTTEDGKSGKDVPKSNYMIPLVALILFVVIAAAVFLMQSEEDEHSEYPEGPLPIGEDRV